MKSLVAVRQTNRDQRPGPRALGGQLVHVRGFSHGWPGQPRLKVFLKILFLFQFNILKTQILYQKIQNNNTNSIQNSKNTNNISKIKKNKTNSIQNVKNTNNISKSSEK